MTRSTAAGRRNSFSVDIEPFAGSFTGANYGDGGAQGSARIPHDGRRRVCAGGLLTTGASADAGTAGKYSGCHHTCIRAHSACPDRATEYARANTITDWDSNRCATGSNCYATADLYAPARSNGD